MAASSAAAAAAAAAATTNPIPIPIPAEAISEECKDDDVLTSTLHTCANDPDFAVICAFLQKFAKDLGLNLPNFKHLQEWLTNNNEGESVCVCVCLAREWKSHRESGEIEAEICQIKLCQVELLKTQELVFLNWSSAEGYPFSFSFTWRERSFCFVVVIK